VRVAYWTIGLGYLVLYAAGGWLLGAHSFALSVFGSLGLLIPSIAVCVIILRRRKGWRGCQRLFWDTFAIGIAFWVVGHIGWAFDDIVRQRTSWLQWHTVFSLCGGIGPLIAILAAPHRGVRSHATGTVSLILASYGLLAFFIYAYFVLVPGLLLTDAGAYGALLSLVQLNRALLFAGFLLAAWFGRRTAWRATYFYLAAGAGLGFVLRVATSLAIVRGDYYTGSLYDLAWIAPFVCYALAATAAPESPTEPAAVEVPAPMTHTAFSAVPVFLIPLVGYATLYVQPLGGSGDAFRALLTGLMTIAGLGLLTIRLAAQGGELQRTDARLRLLAAATEQTGDLILITRANGGFEHANDAFVRALGYSREELSRLTFFDLMERGFESLGAHIGKEVRERGIWRGTLLRRRRDASIFPAACTVVGLKDPTGKIMHFVGVERDISEELSLRDQLVHTERLSAIGELVAGVAHEINNPLQTIVGSVELLLEERLDPSSRKDLEVIRKEAARAGQIVRNLLSFVRRSAPDRTPTDLNEIVRAVVELREYHLQQRNIALEIGLNAAGAQVIVNREEIQQIVLNLLINAEQAILSSSSSEKISGKITVRTFGSGRQQVVEVADDGPGVAPDLRGRVFEPFFTTKEVGQGTGLGLSISHGIASAHGGSLELCSGQRGACFRLTLPAHPAPVSPTAEAAAPKDAEPRRALVIDDEVPIRKLLVRLLQRRGFEVFEADAGAAALEIAGKFPMDLVVCDVLMPGLSGLDVYRRLLDADPAVPGKFIFITGDRALLGGADDTADLPVLSKPFTGADLDAVLAHVREGAHVHGSDRTAV